MKEIIDRIHSEYTLKLRKEFEIDTKINVYNSQDEIDIEYVLWLENKLFDDYKRNSFLGWAGGKIIE